MRTLRILSIAILMALLAGCMLPAASAEYSMPYYIIVDCTNNIVTVYSAEDQSVVRQMICSTGTARFQTIQGTFTMSKNTRKTDRTEWSKLIGGYGKYASRIKGNFLFHSFMYDAPDMDAVNWESYAAMGTNASHGCIRLYLDDAKWIMDNCLPGTKVKIYTGEEPMEYVKVRLYEQTFTIDSGMTYEEYLCMATEDGELGYTSEGEDVKALQLRMAELGLYPGKIDGYYGAEMVYAVEDLQALLDLPVTGVVDSEFSAFIFSDECPSSNISTLYEGMNGPAVATLQRTLAALGLYDGEIDGVFDAETTESVKLFQRALNYKDDGIATPSLQQDMIESIIYLENKFGAAGYTVTFIESPYYTGVIASSQRLNMRAKKSTDSSVIHRLEPGTEVRILEYDDSWAKISYDGDIGYVRTSYLTITEATYRTPEYTAAVSGTPYPKLVYGENEAISRRYTYGIVNINERVKLREAPNTDAELVFMLSPGNICELVSINDGVAYVYYGGKFGYTYSKYFDQIGTAKLTGDFAVPGSLMTDPEAVVNAKMALVANPAGANIHSTASASSDVIATVASEEKLEIIFESTSWVQVLTGEGIIGYISKSDVVIGTESQLDEYIVNGIPVPTPEPTAEPEEEPADEPAEHEMGVVDLGPGNTLNLRDAASTDSNVIVEIPAGTSLTILSDEGEWLLVQYGDKTGYVSSQYIMRLPADIGADETADEE